MHVFVKPNNKTSLRHLCTLYKVINVASCNECESIKPLYKIYKLSSLASRTLPVHGMASPRLLNSERQRINKVMDRAQRLGYYPPDAPTFGDLCDTVHDELFSKARLWSNHVLHPLLPPLSAASQRYSFRQRPHSLQLPEHKTQLSNCNFLIRLLYKNTY